MTAKKIFWISVVIILFLNVIILYLSLGGKNTSTFELFYGDKIPKLNLQDSKGKSISTNDQFNLLYFTDLTSTSDIRIAKYLDFIYKRYNNYGLQIIGIIARKIDKADTLKNNEELSYPIIYNQDIFNNNKIFDSIIHSQFRGIMILDSSNVIKFISSFFKTEDIRQLVEKLILGSISYPPLIPSNNLKVGDIFATISVKNLKKNHIEYFPHSEKTIAIILTGRCPDCVISNFKITYYLLEGKILNYNKRIVLIFSSKFIEEEILNYSKDINSEILLAVGNIPGVEDSFNSIFYFQDEIIVTEINEDGIVTDLASLDKFIRKMKLN